MNSLDNSATESYDLGAWEGAIFTKPSLFTLTPKAMTISLDGRPRQMRIRRRGRKLVLLMDGSPVAAASRAWGGYSITTGTGRWAVSVHKSNAYGQAHVDGADGNTADLVLEHFDSPAERYVSLEGLSSKTYEQMHEGTVSGRIDVSGSVPHEVLAMALRVLAGRKWFNLPTGRWVEGYMERSSGF